MKRILFSHFHYYDYQEYKRCLHEISTEFTVSHVETGEKLFNLLRFFTPDLLIIDLSTSYKDAESALERLVLEEKFRFIKVIIHSDADQRVTNTDLQFAGNNFHLTRPFTKEHLCKTVENALAAEWLGSGKQALAMVNGE